MFNFLPKTLILLILTSQAYALPKGFCTTEMAALAKSVKLSEYQGKKKQQTANRNTEYYEAIFGGDFSDKLQSIKDNPRKHWVDSGAGQASALLGFLEMQEGKNKTEVTGISHKNLVRGKTPNGLSYLSGKYLEEIPSEKIGKADLITDVYGPFAYSPRPEVVLQKYFDLLKPSGEAYIFLGTSYTLGTEGDFAGSSFVITDDGTQIRFLDWLKAIKGANIEITKKHVAVASYPIDLTEGWILKMTKIPGQKIILPEEMHLVRASKYNPKEKTLSLLSKPELENKKPELLAKISRKALKVSRTLEDYNKAFVGDHYIVKYQEEAGLLTSLRTLNAKSLWIDVGGDGSAASDLIVENKGSSPQIALITLPGEKVSSTTQQFKDRVEVLQNTSSSSIDRFSDLPKRGANVLTDYFGLFLMTDDPSGLLEQYLNLIGNKGEIWLSLGEGIYDLSDEAQIITKDQDIVSLKKWLLEIPGIDVQVFQPSGIESSKSKHFARIRIKNRSRIQIPKLKLIALKEGDGNFPGRIFSAPTFTPDYENDHESQLH
jgi:SAM-dependent methyltransferase